MTAPLPFEELEKVYDLLAEALDKVGEENQALFLAKLALTLAHKAGDIAIVREAIEIALAETDE